MLNQVDKVIALAKIAHTFCKNGEEWYRMDSVDDTRNGFYVSDEEEDRVDFFAFEDVDLTKDKFYELKELDPSFECNESTLAMKIQDDVINQVVSGTRSNTDGSISTV